MPSLAYVSRLLFSNKVATLSQDREWHRSPAGGQSSVNTSGLISILLVSSEYRRLVSIDIA